MKKERPMANFVFRIATILMRMRGLFRDKKGEVLLTGAKRGDIILDYGCGIGFNTIPAAEIVGEEGMIYALDIHPLAIKSVERKVREKGLKNVKTILAGLNTGLPDESVDIVLLYNVLPMVKNRPALIKELYRVLKPGGILSVKSGLVVNLYSREKMRTEDLEKLMLDNGPLKLERRIGKFHIFKKIKDDGSTSYNSR
ncbi:MAG: class I SAM-dependent methyltransferase [Thermotogae bacterium]|nr:class I SAM-dependent methyltransferase [Thermotogota bacterium]